MVEIISKVEPLLVALPRGRVEAGVCSLLADAGIDPIAPERGYRPSVSLERVAARSMKPQNIVEMIALGRRLQRHCRIVGGPGCEFWRNSSPAVCISGLDVRDLF